MMQKSLQSLVLLTPALAFAGALAEPASAAQISDDAWTQQLYTQLQTAVCSNDWNQALTVIGPLMGSAGVTPEYRQQLAYFRRELQDLRAARSVYTNLPACHQDPTLSNDAEPVRTIIFSANQTSVDQASADQTGDITAQQLYTALQGSVCSNDWNSALRAIAPLIGSPGISPAYREQLVQYRRQIEYWRAAGAQFNEAAGCRAIATSPTPEPSPARVNWAS